MVVAFSFLKSAELSRKLYNVLLIPSAPKTQPITNGAFVTGGQTDGRPLLFKHPPHSHDTAAHGLPLGTPKWKP